MASLLKHPRFRLYATLLTLGSVVLIHQRVTEREKRALQASTILANHELPDGRGSLEILSSAYVIDRLYQSMEGPASNHPSIQLSAARGDDEILYVTGIRSEVVDKDNRAVVSPEYFCHANLTLNPATTTPEKHNAGFPSPAHMDWRLATLVPGHLALRLPEGFGVPVKNGTRLDYYTMALNQNAGAPHQTVRIRSRIDYTRAPATRALFRRAVYVHQQYQDVKGAAVAAKPAAHAGSACGQSCDRNQLGADHSLFVDLSVPAHPGATCCVGNASAAGIMAQFGGDNTIHWMVPPGKHSYKTDVTAQMELPYDTTAHMITGHLHPYGRSMRLVDKQTGKVLFEITSQDFSDKVGVQKMSEIPLPQGVPMRKGAPLELVCDYENTTAQPIDAMAILYLYLAESPDKELLVAR